MRPEATAFDLAGKRAQIPASVPHMMRKTAESRIAEIEQSPSRTWWLRDDARPKISVTAPTTRDRDHGPAPTDTSRALTMM